MFDLHRQGVWSSWKKKSFLTALLQQDVCHFSIDSPLLQRSRKPANEVLGGGTFPGNPRTPTVGSCCHISSELFFFNFSSVLITPLDEHLLPGASWHGGRLPCRRSVRATRHGLARQQHGQHGVAWHVGVRRGQQLARQRLAEELCGRADLLLHAEPATVWGDFHDSLRTGPRPLRPVPRPWSLNAEHKVRKEITEQMFSHPPK